MNGISRRKALGRIGSAVLAAAGAPIGAAAAGCGFETSWKDRRGGPGTVGFTVQTSNYLGILDAEIAALGDLGADFVRMPLNNGDPSGGRTIVRRLLDAGVSILGITAGYEGLRTDDFRPVPVAAWEAYLADLLRIFPEIRYWQILNEPRSFEHISEETYVRTYLASAHDLMKGRVPGITVVSAAPTGNRDGPAQFRRMVDAGLENWCDVAAVHVYGASPGDYAAQVPNPVWVTETGANGGPEAQLAFFRSRVPSMVDGPLGAARVFWYDLLDDPAAGGTYGLLGPDGRPVNRALYDEIGEFNRGRLG